MDVAVIGGGIVGTAAAAFLAEAGAEVTLAEQTEIGAGASGRNSGAVQHPFDPALTALHEETVELFRELEAPGTDAFPLDSVYLYRYDNRQWVRTAGPFATG